MTPHERFAAYFDDDTTPEDAAEFRAWLASDPEHARDFVRYAALHQALREELKGREIRREESVARTTQRPSPQRQSTWLRWGAIAAAVCLAAFGFSRFMHTDPALVVFTARIEKIQGPVLFVDRNGVSRQIAKERELISEKTSLEFDGPGRAVVSFFDGTVLDMSVQAAGGALRLERPEGRPNINRARVGKRVSIQNGVLSASIAHQPDGQPMIVCTPHAEATIVGTQFSLDANATATHLTVTEGKIHIVRYLDESSADVSAGETIVVNDTEPLRVRKITEPNAPPN